MHCPVDALTLGPNGQVIVSPTVCILCGTCQKACPIGAIELFEEFVYVCDLCGGDPRCVQACTENAITYQPEITEEISLEEIKQQTGKMNPSQKRQFYLSQMGAELRKQWSKHNG